MTITGILVIILFVVNSLVALTFGYLAGIPFTTLLIYAGGFLFYILFINFSARDNHLKVDYIQSGEATIGSFVIFVSAIFISGDTWIILLLTFLSLVAFQCYVHFIIAPERNEAILNGILIHCIAVAIIILIADRSTLVNTFSFQKALLGYFHFTPIGLVEIIPLAVLFIISLLILIFFGHELDLHSQGREFFSPTGISYTAVRFAGIAVRSILLTGLLCLAGWFCGIGFYLRSMSRTRADVIKSCLTAFMISSILMITAHFIDTRYIIASSALLSYLALLLYRHKGIDLYDRYQ